VTSITILELAG